jgi:biopolymer transport protein ExbB
MELLRNSYDYLQQGGWMMIPLSICSLVMWVMIFERIWFYRTLQKKDITADLALRVIQGETVQLYSKGLKTRLVREFGEERTGVPHIDRASLRQRVARLREDLTRFLAVIAVLAAIAPILGLLGTVLGMIETFDVISLYGTGNAKAMAGGISVALVTTQTGLLIAIPGLFFSGMLSRLSRRLSTRLEETAAVLDRALKNQNRLEEGLAK